MVYKVIGLMSGSSLDGLDVAYTYLTEISGKWTFEILHTDCIPYDPQLVQQLSGAAQLSVPDFLRLHTSYGAFTGQRVKQFIEKYDLQHKVDFVVSHGHTVWHEPASRTTSQIGDGAAIAAALQLPVISDLRHVDIAYGGQGAPIVPIADHYLFTDYQFLLNIGGIANVTVNQQQPVAFDICPANQLLNFFAQKTGAAFDEDGILARTGAIDSALLDTLNTQTFYSSPSPKSLHNGYVHEALIPHFSTDDIPGHLATSVQHIAMQIAEALAPFVTEAPQQMLVTGGGALNSYLIEAINRELEPHRILAIAADPNLAMYKEALAMALIGTLRWREEVNVQASVTGASQSSVGGAMWLY